MGEMPMPQEKVPPLMEKLKRFVDDNKGRGLITSSEIAEVCDLIEALPEAIDNDQRIVCRRTCIEEMYNRSQGGTDAEEIAGYYDEPVEWVEEVLENIQP